MTEVPREEVTTAAEPIATIASSLMIKPNPHAAVTTAPIVSEEDLDIETSLPTPPPPDWGLNEKEKKEDVVVVIVVASPAAAKTVTASAATDPKESVGL